MSARLRDQRRNVHVIASLLLLCVLILLLFNFLQPAVESVRLAYEKTMFRFAPTAARAYTYGDEHFQASDTNAYDINAAEYFFLQAAFLDPHYPYVYHQLARVAFLKGDLATALERINVAIEQHRNDEPNTYYVRGLIEGYMGDYADAANDYQHFLQSDPKNWAGLNDYAWVLLKAKHYHDAANATARGLQYFPNNPWLLNSRATALYELHDYPDALIAAQGASAAVASVSESAWLEAYPGNNPDIANQGVASFRQAVADNMHMVEVAIDSGTIQSSVTP